MLPFQQDSALVGFKNASPLREVTLAAAPAGHHEKARVTNGKTLGCNGIKESDQDKLAVALLAHIITKNTGL
jgi:hypothetical protein